MTYTREQIEKELIKANKATAKARAAQNAAEKARQENKPRRAENISRFDRGTDEYRAAVEEWAATYCTAADKARAKATAAALYEKAVSEMLEKAICAEIDAVISSTEFLDRFDGTPVRYKNLQKALFSGFDSRYHFYFTGVWNCRIGYTFRPVKGQYPDFSGDFYYIGDMNTNGDTYISREEVEKRLKGREEYYAKGLGTRYEQPEFAAVKRACNRAAAIAKKHDEILEAAAAKASALVDSNSCGLSVVRDAMQGGKSIEYRR